MSSTATRGLSWPSIVRLSLVQVAIGAVVVLMTSTLNRVMVVELGLMAAIPGALVAVHFFVQLLRPRMGFGSDAAGRRIPWIIAGMALVSVSGVGAAGATVLMETDPSLGAVAAVVSFVLLGVGVSAASTPLLAMLAEGVEESRMAGAAAVAWIMMILGIIITAGVAGALLDPYSPTRLLAVVTGVATVAFLLTVLGVIGRREGDLLHRRVRGTGDDPTEHDFREVFSSMFGEPETRLFATFIFVSMLAYSAQDIILEPFAGTVFGMTPGESTAIAGLQHAGVLIGMIAGAVAAARVGTLTGWSAAGCLASTIALGGLIASPTVGSVAFLKGSIFSLGFANGVFAVAAIGAMMGLTIRGRTGGAGLRMGFWGAAQAMAYGLGGFAGALASDFAREATGSAAAGYSVVFAGEAVLFVAAAVLVLRVRSPREARGVEPLREAGRAMAMGG